MSLADILGAPVADSAAPDAPPQHLCREPQYVEPDRTPAPPRHSRSVILLAVLAALLAGAVAGWFGAGFIEDGPSPGDAEATLLPAEIAGYAELYTAQELTETSESGQPTTWINQTASVNGEQVDAHTWLVTVAVDSLELVDAVYRPAELQHFNVLITSVGGRPAAIGLPARVPAPNQGDRAATLFSDPIPDDQGVAAVAFIQEYLTGGNELGRYLETPSDITRFETAPYGRVEARPLGANTLGQIDVAVTATKDNGITHQLEYVLTMTIADGVWVVADASPATG